MKTTAAGRPAPRSLVRRAALTGAGIGLALGVAAAYAPSIAYAETPAPSAAPAWSAASVPVPTDADFRDCPALPTGVDPARWRCEVHSVASKLRIGSVDLPALAPITMTHGEGPLPDGSEGQVWGSMHSAPTAVPGGLLGTPAADRIPLLGLTLQPEYGGRFDAYTGRMSLRFRLRSPLLPAGCAIGAGAPADFRLKRSGPSQWISQHPPVIKFSAYDDSFTAPAAGDCGPLTDLLDQRLGLPAASGNRMTYDAVYTFRMYDRLTTGH